LGTKHKKTAKRPPLTDEQRAVKLALQEERKGTTSQMGLLAVGNRGQPPTKYTPEFLEQLAKDLEAWSLKDNAYFISGFLSEYKEFIPEDKLNLFTEEDSPVFRSTFIKVKMRLLNRIREKTLEKKLDGNFCAKILPLIDPEYRKWRQEELKLEAEGSSERTINIKVLPGIGRNATPEQLELIEDEK